MGERVLTAFKWALVASLLTGNSALVAATILVGIVVVLVGNDLAHD